MPLKIGENRIIKKIKKPMGLILTPLAFAFLLALIILLALNFTVGDVIGYGSVLFMKTENTNDADNLFMPSSKETGTVNIKDVDFPTHGKVYGEILIDSVGIDCPLIYGDSKNLLWRGACQYMGSTIIGYGGTTMACAHVNRHFKNLSKVSVDDYIKINTTYGSYIYKVVYTGIHKDSDKTAYDLTREDENLVLYTCFYEHTAFGNVKKRFFVRADFVSGPLIDKEVTK